MQFNNYWNCKILIILKSDYKKLSIPNNERIFSLVDSPGPEFW